MRRVEPYRPRESTHRSSRIRLPATNYAVDYYDDEGCCSCGYCTSRPCKSRFKTITLYAVICIILFVAVHYLLYTYGVAIFRLNGAQRSEIQPLSPQPTDSTPEDRPLTNELPFDTAAKLKAKDEDILHQPSDLLDLTSLAIRLNVSQATFNESYFTAINKVVFLRFQDEMNVYWKSEVPLYESKGVVLLFHNCKGNGQEWWSLLRDDFSFTHFQPKYSLPNEIRISSGFLQEGYWVVALSPVTNQRKNGCWVKEDRVFIPPLVEYLRILRRLAYEHHQHQRQRHGSHRLGVEQAVSKLMATLSSSSSRSHPAKPLPTLPIYGLGVTNGGAFLNQQLKYWLNPLPDTPPASHPHPIASSEPPRRSDDRGNAPDVPHHGFDGSGIIRKRQPWRSADNIVTTTTTARRALASSVAPDSLRTSSPLHKYLLATQPTLQVVGPPVRFEAIILLNAGIWHQEYFPPNAPKRKTNNDAAATPSVEAHHWALMPPVLFVDYARNGDVVWHNAQTLQKLQSLDARRAEVRQQLQQHHLHHHHQSQTIGGPEQREAERRLSDGTDGLSRVFAAQLVSEPYPLYPEYFADQLAVLYPRNQSHYPRHRVRLTKATVVSKGSSHGASHGLGSPFGTTLVHTDTDNIRNDIVSMEPMSEPHVFTLPDTAVYTVEDSVRLFFSLYVGDLLDDEEVNRLHTAFRRRRQQPQQLDGEPSQVTDEWTSTVQEILANHQRDGIERFIWPGSHVLFKDVAGHIHLPRLLKLCHRSAPSFFRDVDHLTDVDPARQDRGLHSPTLQAIRKAWAWRETNDEYVAEMVAWFNDHR